MQRPAAEDSQASLQARDPVDELSAVLDAELAKGVAQVRAHCREANAQPLRDGLVAKSDRRELDDRTFPLAEAGPPRCGERPLRRRCVGREGVDARRTRSAGRRRGRIALLPCALQRGDESRLDELEQLQRVGTQKFQLPDAPDPHVAEVLVAVPTVEAGTPVKTVAMEKVVEELRLHELG